MLAAKQCIQMKKKTTFTEIRKFRVTSPGNFILKNTVSCNWVVLKSVF